MSAAIADRELDVAQDVQVIHALRGRLRAHLVNRAGKGQWQIESRLRALAGVRSAQANLLTGCPDEKPSDKSEADVRLRSGPQ